MIPILVGDEVHNSKNNEPCNNMEQCKSSKELLKANGLTRDMSNKIEDSHSVTAISISMKLYPKDCWGGFWSHQSHVLLLHNVCSLVIVTIQEKQCMF